MSESRIHNRRRQVAQAAVAKLKRDLAEAERKLAEDQALSPQQRQSAQKHLRAQVADHMQTLRMEHEEGLRSDLEGVKRRLYSLDENERTNPTTKMAWRDAVSRAGQIGSADEAALQFEAAVLAGDKLWMRALGLVGESRAWGPDIHKRWYQTDRDAAKVMDEYDELEAAINDRTERLADSSIFSLGAPVVEDVGGGAPQLAD
jgi:hypothetical protein